MTGRSLASVLLVLLTFHGLLLCGLQLVVVDSAGADDDDEGVIEDGSCFHLQVSPPADAPEDAAERREHYRAMEAKDLFRHEQIISMAPGGLRNDSSGGRREARESSKLPEKMSGTASFELPMRSALNIAHVGMYLVSVRFGTPALPYSLVLDTANDLTWINCRLRRRKGKHYGRESPAAAAAQTMSVGGGGGEEEGPKKPKLTKHWYRPAKSSSWRRIRCSQKECAELPHNTCKSPSRIESCSYFQKVQDNTVTAGIYGTEKATVTLSDGKMAKLPGLILGCSTLEAGGSVDAHDGTLSLGNGLISFGSHAAMRFGGRFSFCLLSANSGPNASSYLTFGPNPAMRLGPAGTTMETRLVFNVDVTVGLGPPVTGITVGGQLLDIPPEVWDDSILGGGVILDTGTSVTGLVPEAYDAVTAALDVHLAHLPRVRDVAGFDFCYRWTFAGDGVDPANNVTIPSFTVEMEGGARLDADAKNVIMPEVEKGVACLGFRKLLLGGPVVFGNVLMQEYIWEFDHHSSKLRFRKDKCSTHHLHNQTAVQQHSSSHNRYIN
ncbi:hypothetical protein U9M48_045073 [Paspalum notatum var. saurae]|uniref:Peptidase A1 domain-containing protein n=1 Tax=Paspalum notatum var. saurae TaxID=547442 RepID=A0AAQ3V167_PASNO